MFKELFNLIKSDSLYEQALDRCYQMLDIDSQMFNESINSLRNSDRAIILVTHYQRLLEYIKPDYVHVMIEGRIALSGDKTLALKLEEQGYDWLLNNQG